MNFVVTNDFNVPAEFTNSIYKPPKHINNFQVLFQATKSQAHSRLWNSK